ncbi:MAG TPA: hypothetical protein VGP63_30055 [Planctomycetaceae bacterium]|jgi:hypothetical protein|nr:hypothetical protein [Planctomycetaceae bacterium]
MRSPLSGSIATCLIFVPLVAVPLLAVLGMPQLSANSPTGAIDDLKFAAEDPAAGNSELSNPVRVSDSQADSAPSKRPPRTVAKNSDPFAEFSRDSDSSSRPAESADKSGPPRKRPQRWSEGNGLPQKALLSIDRPSDDHASANPSDRPAAIDEQTAESPGREASLKTPGARRALPEAQAVVAMASEPMTASASGDIGAEGRASAGVPTGSVNATSWKRAISRLNALGIQDYQLQPGERDGEFNFSCRFAARSNPHVIHRFEAEAADPLEAVNQVLRQLDDWRARHSDRRQAARDPAADEKTPTRGADSSQVEITNRAF